MMVRILQHTLFWLTILIWTSAIYELDGNFSWRFIMFNAVRMPLIIIATYLVLYYFLPRYLIRKRNYFKFGLGFFLTFLTTTALDRLLIGSSIVEDILYGINIQYSFFNQIPILRNAFILIAIMGLASLIRFFKLYLQQEREKHELQEENLQTQLSFLKAQVNPHFLFNALNNLYSTAIRNNQPEISDGLENLSGIMHYLTYESNAQKVPLEKEIKLINNYIDIQQARFRKSDDVTISFNVEGATDGRMIAPVILLPLVENAFKHGVRPEQKSLVHIYLALDSKRMIFTVKNSIYPTRKDPNSSGGIGFQNVQKRLRLIYNGKHQLKTWKHDKYYFSQITLQN